MAVGRIELCISVDDLPLHGARHPELSRAQIVDLFLQAFSKHQVPAVVGFMNGGLTEPALVGEVLRLGNRRKLIKLFNGLARSGLIDARSYCYGQFPENSSQFIDILRKWVDAGHVIGNHNYWHSDLNNTTTTMFIKGIEKNERLIHRVTKERSVFFRYPYLKEGATATRREEVRNYLRSKEYVISPATVDFHDWAWNRAYLRSAINFAPARRKQFEEKYIEMAVLALKASVLAARRLFGRDIRQILVLHVGAFTAISLDSLLERFAAESVRFIDMKEALADDVYSQLPDMNYPCTGGSFLSKWNFARNGSSCLVDRSVMNAKLF